MKQFIELGLVIFIWSVKIMICIFFLCDVSSMLSCSHAVASCHWCSWMLLLQGAWPSIACRKRTDVSTGVAPLFHTHCVCRSVWLYLVKPMRHFHEVQLCWTNSDERVFQVSDDIHCNRISEGCNLSYTSWVMKTGRVSWLTSDVT